MTQEPACAKCVDCGEPVALTCVSCERVQPPAKPLQSTPDPASGISVYYGVATCHGCGEARAFEGKMVDGLYHVTGKPWAEHEEWRQEHAGHVRTPEPFASQTKIDPDVAKEALRLARYCVEGVSTLAKQGLIASAIQRRVDSLAAQVDWHDAMQAAFAVLRAVGVEGVEFCTHCKDEPGYVPRRDRCPECKREGVMSTYYGDPEKRLRENDLAEIVVNAMTQQTEENKT